MTEHGGWRYVRRVDRRIAQLGGLAEDPAQFDSLRGDRERQRMKIVGHRPWARLKDAAGQVIENPTVRERMLGLLPLKLKRAGSESVPPRTARPFPGLPTELVLEMYRHLDNAKDLHNLLAAKWHHPQVMLAALAQLDPPQRRRFFAKAPGLAQLMVQGLTDANEQPGRRAVDKAGSAKELLDCADQAMASAKLAGYAALPDVPTYAGHALAWLEKAAAWQSREPEPKSESSAALMDKSAVLMTELAHAPWAGAAPEDAAGRNARRVALQPFVDRMLVHLERYAEPLNHLSQLQSEGRIGGGNVAALVEFLAAGTPDALQPALDPVIRLAQRLPMNQRFQDAPDLLKRLCAFITGANRSTEMKGKALEAFGMLATKAAMPTGDVCLAVQRLSLALPDLTGAQQDRAVTELGKLVTRICSQPDETGGGSAAVRMCLRLLVQGALRQESEIHGAQDFLQRASAIDPALVPRLQALCDKMQA